MKARERTRPASRTPSQSAARLPAWLRRLREFTRGCFPRLTQGILGSVQKAVQFRISRPNWNKFTFHKALAILTCHIFCLFELYLESLA